MSVTFSVVAILGVLVVLLLRFRAIGFGAGVLVLLFGYFLADTGMAPTIDHLFGAVVTALQDLAN